jgi:hypothetical protein
LAFEEQQLLLSSKAAWILDGNSALDQLGMKTTAAAAEMESGRRLSDVHVGSVAAADTGRGVVAVGFVFVADT